MAEQIVVITDAPSVYDYEGIVLSSKDLGTASMARQGWRGPWRRVTLVADPYLSERQTARYRSGAWVTFTNPSDPLSGFLWNEEVEPYLDVNPT